MINKAVIFNREGNMKTIFNCIYNVKLERFVATWCTLFMIVIMFMNVVLRYGFNFAFNWGDEIVRYLNIYAAFFAISAAYKNNGHIAIDTVVEQLIPKKLKKFFRLASEIVSLLFCLFCLWFGVVLTLKLLGTGQQSPGLGVPMFLMYMVIPLGMALSSIQIIIRIFYDKSYLEAKGYAA